MQTKREFRLFQPFQASSILPHIEHMASQGWAVTAINDLFLTYQKIKPQQRTYTMTFTGSPFYLIAPKKQDQQAIIQSFQEDGFIPSAKIRNIQFFYTTKPDAFPLSERSTSYLVDTVQCMKTFLYWNIVVSFFLCFILGCSFLSTFTQNPIYILSNFLTSMLYILLPIIMFLFIIHSFLYLPITKKNITTIKSGENFLPLSKSAQIATSFCSIISWLLLLCILGIFLYYPNILLYDKMVAVFAFLLPFLYLGSVNFLQNKLQHRFSEKTITKLSVGTVIGIALIFICMQTVMIFRTTTTPPSNKQISYALPDTPKGNFPVYITDFIDIPNGTYTTTQEYQSSPFVTKYDSYHNLNANDTYSLYYHIVDVHTPIFFDICKNDFMKIPYTDKEWNKTPFTLKNSDTADIIYDFDENSYLLTKSNRIIYFVSDIPFDTTQLENIAEQLFTFDTSLAAT